MLARRASPAATNTIEKTGSALSSITTTTEAPPRCLRNHTLAASISASRSAASDSFEAHGASATTTQ
jgi:hypothetical protein